MSGETLQLELNAQIDEIVEGLEFVPKDGYRVGRTVYESHVTYYVVPQ